MIPVGILTAAQTSSASFLLDLYPNASLAYSLRKLRSAYTGPAIRVQVFTQMDIGFDANGNLDTTTLLAFAGSNTAIVVTWYDQSGNGNNGTVNVNNAPKIVELGVLKTLGARPAIRFTPISFFNFTSNIVADTNISIFMSGKSDSTTTEGPFLGGTTPPTGFYGMLTTNFIAQIGLNGSAREVYGQAGYLTANYTIWNIISNSTNIFPYKNNTAQPFTLNPNAAISMVFANIGRYGGFYINGNITEVIIYKTDQLSNRTNIVNNINTYYTIF